MNQYEIVGKRILQARTEKGMSQEELGKLVGNIGRSGVYSYEKGKYKAITFEKIEQFANALDVTLEWLWYGRGEKNVISISDLTEEQIVLLKNYKERIKG